MTDHRPAVFTAKCSTCIFWPGNRAWLNPGRLAEVIADNRATGSMLTCHHTTYVQAPEPVMCRGFWDAYATTSRVPQIMTALFGPDWYREVPPPTDDPHQPHEPTQEPRTMARCTATPPCDYKANGEVHDPDCPARASYYPAGSELGHLYATETLEERARLTSVLFELIDRDLLDTADYDLVSPDDVTGGDTEWLAIRSAVRAGNDTTTIAAGFRLVLDGDTPALQVVTA